MPQSPDTFKRRRRSSGLNLPLTPTKPQVNDRPSLSHHTNSHKSSIQSIHSPTTPPSQSVLDILDRSRGFPLSGDLVVTGHLANGLGSLADELAEEGWDNGEELEDPTLSIYNDQRTDDITSSYSRPEAIEGVRTAYFPSLHEEANRLVNASEPGRSNTNLDSQNYDNSEHEETFTMEGPGGISPALETQMALVESLAWHGAASDFEFDEFVRMTAQLKELHSQASTESHTMRLATAHTALTAHISHQARVLTTLAHPLISPLVLPPSPEAIESIIPLISSLVISVPRPTETALPSIHALHLSTIELIGSLSYLSDNLHMNRQTTTQARRRLRIAREVAGMLKREIDKAEEGERWLEIGSWTQRLKKREAAQICREIVEGFDEVLRNCRARLEMDVA